MIIKRILDIIISFTAIMLLSPLLLITAFLVWLQDFHSPLYIAPRVGKDEEIFNMIKLRSMIVNADKTGVDSTSACDARITTVGHFIRRFKLDEITQLWNVFIGDMSLVGPRPNVKRETDLYTLVEKKLLSVKPGITDFASIVFSDENDILKDSKDPDLDYNQLIRPWKSRLGLFYIVKKSLTLDIALIALTLVALLSRRMALSGVVHLLSFLGADSDVIDVSQRKDVLSPFPPPGSNVIVTSR